MIIVACVWLTALLEYCVKKGGIVKHHEMGSLSQTARRCIVPKRMHPFTADDVATQEKIVQKNTLMTAYFKNQNVDGDKDKKRMRLATTSSEEDSQCCDSHDSNVSGEGEDSENASVLTLNSYVPHGMEQVIGSMMKELNETYATIPDMEHRNQGDLYKAYDLLRAR